MVIDNEEEKEKNPRIGNLVSIPSRKKVSKHSKSVIEPTVLDMKKDDENLKSIDNTQINTALEPRKGNLQNTEVKKTPRMRLTSPKALRKSMAKIMKMAVLGEVPIDTARSLAYLAQTLSGCFKLEADLGVEKVLKEMRKEIQALENSGKI
jgi:hypothetical protein